MLYLYMKDSSLPLPTFEISYPALELEKKGKNNIEIVIQSVNKLCPIRIHMYVKF